MDDSNESKLKEELEGKSIAIAELENKLVASRNENAILQKKTDSLSITIQELEIIRKDLMEKVETLYKKSKGIPDKKQTKEVQELSQELQKARSSISDLRKENEKLSKSVHTLPQGRKSSESLNNNVSSDTQQYLDQIEALKSLLEVKIAHIAEIEKSKAQDQEEKAKLDSMLNEISNDSNLKAEEIKNYQDKTQLLENRANEMNTKYNTLLNDNEVIATKLREAENESLKATTYQQEIEKLKGNLEQEASKTKELEIRSKQDLLDVKAILDATSKELEDTRGKLNADIAAKEGEISKLKTDLQEYQQKNNERKVAIELENEKQKGELISLKEDVERLKVEKESIISEFNLHKMHLQTLQNENDLLKKASQEGSAASDEEKNSLQLKLESLLNTADTSKRELEEKSNQLNNIENTLMQLKVELQSKEQKLTQQQNRIDEIPGLESQLANLERSLQEATGKAQTWQEKYENMQGSDQNREQLIEKLNKELVQKKQELNERKVAFEELNLKIEHYQKIESQVEEKNKEIHCLKEDIAHSEGRERLTTDEKNKLQSKVQELTEILSHQQDEIAEFSKKEANMNVYETELAAIRTELANLKEEHQKSKDALQQANEKFLFQLQEKEDALKTSQQKYDNLTMDLERLHLLEKEFKEKETLCLELQTKCDELEKDAEQQAAKDNESFLLQLQEMEDAFKKSQQKNENLTMDLERLHLLEKEIKVKETLCLELQTKCDELTESERNIMEEKELLDSKLNEVLEQNLNQTKSQMVLQSKYEDLSKELDVLGRLKSELEEKNSELNSLQEVCNHTKELEKMLEEKNRKLETNIQEMNVVIAEQTSKIEKLEELKNNVEYDIEKHHSLKEEFEMQKQKEDHYVRQIEETTSDRNQLKTKIKELSETISMQEKAITQSEEALHEVKNISSVLKNDLEQLNVEKEVLLQHNILLQNDILAASTEYAQKEREKNEEIQKLRETVEHLKITKQDVEKQLQSLGGENLVEWTPRTHRAVNTEEVEEEKEGITEQPKNEKVYHDMSVCTEHNNTSENISRSAEFEILQDTIEDLEGYLRVAAQTMDHLRMHQPVFSAGNNFKGAEWVEGTMQQNIADYIQEGINASAGTSPIKSSAIQDSTEEGSLSNIIDSSLADATNTIYALRKMGKLDDSTESCKGNKTSELPNDAQIGQNPEVEELQSKKEETMHEAEVQVIDLPCSSMSPTRDRPSPIFFPPHSPFLQPPIPSTPTSSAKEEFPANRFDNFATEKLKDERMTLHQKDKPEDYQKRGKSNEEVDIEDRIEALTVSELSILEEDNPDARDKENDNFQNYANRKEKESEATIQNLLQELKSLKEEREDLRKDLLYFKEQQLKQTHEKTSFFFDKGMMKEFPTLSKLREDFQKEEERKSLELNSSLRKEVDYLFQVHLDHVLHDIMEQGPGASLLGSKAGSLKHITLTEVNTTDTTSPTEERAENSKEKVLPAVTTEELQKHLQDLEKQMSEREKKLLELESALTSKTKEQEENALKMEAEKKQTQEEIEKLKAEKIRLQNLVDAKCNCNMM